MSEDRIPRQRVSKKVIEEALRLIESGDRSTGNPELDRLLNQCLMCKRDTRDETEAPCDFCRPRPNYSDLAPEGQVFVCGACGKTSKSIYGNPSGSIAGWDESCMLNAVLCYEQKNEAGNWEAVQGY